MVVVVSRLRQGIRLRQNPAGCEIIRWSKPVFVNDVL
jgi:hypothetical protein